MIPFGFQLFAVVPLAVVIVFNGLFTDIRICYSRFYVKALSGSGKNWGQRERDKNL